MARMTIKSYGEKCENNHECETDCCLRFRGRGGRRGGGGRRGDGDRGGRGGRDGGRGGDRLLRSSSRSLQGEIFDVEKVFIDEVEEEEDERFEGKVCTDEDRCDDDDDDTLYSVWNFFAGILIGGLCICVCLQYKYFQWQREDAAKKLR